MLMKVIIDNVDDDLQVDVSYSGGRIRMTMNQNTVTKTTGPIIFSSSIAFGLNLVEGLPGLSSPIFFFLPKNNNIGGAYVYVCVFEIESPN